MRACATVVFACTALAVCGVEAAGPEGRLAERRFQLPNGVRVRAIHAPDARKQTTFALYPLTLVNDDANHAQWSHLVEHMLIRTTDPEGLSAEGIVFNGETTHAYLRLETFADPPQWQAALRRHVTWLTARSVEGDRLEREKEMIAREELGTATGCFTAKFALAAWNQAVTHGLRHAAVHADVQNARAEDVADYARRRLPIDDSILIATIGPIAPDEIERELRRMCAPAAAPPRHTALPQPERTDDDPPHRGVPTVQWDLPTRHALWWWRLPDRRPQTLAAATAIARALHMRFAGKRERAQSVRRVMVTPIVTTPDGTFLVFDACIEATTDPERIGEGVRECTSALRDPGDAGARQLIEFSGRLAAQEQTAEPDFEDLARQMPAAQRDLVEGFWLLGVLNIEYAWEVDIEHAQRWLRDIDPAALVEVLARLEQPAGSLVIEPAPGAAP